MEQRTISLQKGRSLTLEKGIRRLTVNLIDGMDEWYDNPEKMYAAGLNGKKIQDQPEQMKTMTLISWLLNWTPTDVQ